MLTALLIFGMQLILMPIVTLRTILLVKNETKKASAIGVLEAVINVLSLGIVFSDMSRIINIAAYALGFGCGLYIGGLVEKKLAIGYVTYQVSLLDKNYELIDTLRKAGFGVTIFETEGISARRSRLEVLAKRTREKELLTIINEIAPKAFVVSYEARTFKGGYLTKVMKKNENLNSDKKAVQRHD
ncbi:DUF2179 domain-containing protein [Aneurinibacillus aneurinilyticus]|uniref:UPF0316 protein HF838_15715 n=2 Tax=Aneurinibacillus aneurinilyticus TaxID=1391 RepID=A0A848CX48_ANEAE|nr:DUF2179 domain-containing protein [Aneurinibacillus aneurinilyticus]MCI1695194.1 DUF2179 domain-containing protein [Aneurinibacillus aneurinilyticus]MED0673271.1 DUF2179 domain-containing protein [Aneurinibacillus aneurinilyticus]MED0707357.1 DUF2179 domain-containing protein [Aneurinibacillus aneurinilyticus]MED0721596.1 DUF2179 domain-containing protein [Aneurinibacillus aneurinilyticus]MED0731671.1 DUF2179 domain-containing protein [Aneurinibacillus aneurinilyticus]